MTPAELARLKQTADLVRFDTWDVEVEYGCGAQGCDDGGDVLGSIAFDALPPDVRHLVESVPLLVAKIERLESAIAQAILAGA